MAMAPDLPMTLQVPWVAALGLTARMGRARPGSVLACLEKAWAPAPHQHLLFHLSFLCECSSQRHHAEQGSNAMCVQQMQDDCTTETPWASLSLWLFRTLSLHGSCAVQAEERLPW